MDLPKKRRQPMALTQRQLYIGVMSGTSMDGIDAVLVDLSGQRFHSVIAHQHNDYPGGLRKHLLQLALESPSVALAEWADLDVTVARAFSCCVKELLRNVSLSPTQVRALGSHGQTVFHRPYGPLRSTLQLGDPNRIASDCGITTVSDFRRRDLAEGGQGAPLVPAFHHALFSRGAERRCIANIGGIANVTVLPDAQEQHVRGYDTGPGNALMDEWCTRHCHQTYDVDGEWARSGILHGQMLEMLLTDPFIAGAPPKSTGRDYFNLSWAQQRYPTLHGLPPSDVQRTFCELTARTIAGAAQTEGAQRLLVCGGGGANRFLMERLRAAFKEGPVELTDAHGLPYMQVEAAAFAWLAMRTLAGRPGNLPNVTGARKPAVLGGIYQP